MALFDGNFKDVLSKAKDKIEDSTKDISAQFKEGGMNFSAQLKENKAFADEAKAPIEGAIKRYTVIYVGGLPQYPKSKCNGIGLNILQTCFYFKPEKSAQDWFSDLVIQYDSITKFEIVKRTVSNTEMLLSSSGSDMKSLEQENNINITYIDENGVELCLRIEMLTGTTIYGQAAKCRELIDILRQSGIYKIINKSENSASAQNPIADSPIEQIKKLQELKESGILTEDEFNSKKTELLAKI